MELFLMEVEGMKKDIVQRDQAGEETFTQQELMG